MRRAWLAGSKGKTVERHKCGDANVFIVYAYAKFWVRERRAVFYKAQKDDVYDCC